MTKKYIVTYENRNGTEEKSLFEGSWAVDVFTNAITAKGGEILDVAGPHTVDIAEHHADGTTVEWGSEDE